MKPLAIFAAFSLIYASATAEEPIELLCKTHQLHCANGVCYGSAKPNWVFSLKSFFGKYTAKETFLIDEKEGAVEIGQSRYSTRPKIWAGADYADLQITPTNIRVNIRETVDCPAGVDCEPMIHRRISVNRINGEFLNEFISTDGTTDAPLGTPVAADFGYCAGIKRKF